MTRECSPSTTICSHHLGFSEVPTQPSSWSEKSLLFRLGVAFPGNNLKNSNWFSFSRGHRCFLVRVVPTPPGERRRRVCSAEVCMCVRQKTTVGRPASLRKRLGVSTCGHCSLRVINSKAGWLTSAADNQTGRKCFERGALRVNICLPHSGCSHASGFPALDCLGNSAEIFGLWDGHQLKLPGEGIQALSQRIRRLSRCSRAHV